MKLRFNNSLAALLGFMLIGAAPAVAQTDETLPAQVRSVPTQHTKSVLGHASGAVAGKNTEVIDTVAANRAFIYAFDAESNSFRFGVDSTNVPHPDTACFLYYNHNEAIKGYLGGTRDTTTVTRRDGNGNVVETYLAYVAQHGIRFQTPIMAQAGGFYVDRVYTFFADGTSPNLQTNTLEDPYYYRLYRSGANGSITATTQPIFEQAFSMSEFPITWTPGTGFLSEIFFFYPNNKPEQRHILSGGAGANYTLMLDVNNAEADDTLNLTYLSNHCVPNAHPDGILYLRDSETFAYKGFSTFPFFYGGREAFNAGTTTRYPYAPAIIPILFFDTDYVSRNDKFEIAKQGGLQLFNAYPIPAVDYTNLRFHLEHNDDVTIRVMDNTGREVRNVQFRALAGETTHTLDTRDLPCGAYSFIVQTHQGMLGSRFLIER